MATPLPTFTLKSKDLGGQFTNRHLGSGFGCTGDNVSPQLSWENAPQGTESFAITIHDEDAPTGSGFWHWVVYNIPVEVTELCSDAGNFSQQNLPAGAMHGRNDAGVPGYVGPCPPAGQEHLYLITIHALKTKLTVEQTASPAMVGFMLTLNRLGQASLAVYGRS